MIVSVVVVAKNEQQNIARCIKSIVAQKNIKASEFEIILVDDGSTDNTVNIALEEAESLVVISNPGSSISSNRNKGWQVAKGEYIAYIDADCEASPTWLESLLNEMTSTKDENIAAVGGSNTPPKQQSRFYDALAVMLSTYVGSRGSVQGTVLNEAQYVDHLPGLNILLRKEVLALVGGYDEAFALVAEDEDLSHRIRSLGYSLRYIPNANIIHHQRDNLKSWAKNMFTYGKGRSWLIHRHPQSFSIVFALPLFALLLFPLYLIFITAYAFLVCLRHKCFKHLIIIWALYICTHIAYAFGMLYGFKVKGDTSEAIERSSKQKLFLMALKNAGNIGDEAIFISCSNRLRQLDDGALGDKVFGDNVYLMGLGPSGVDVRLLPNNELAVEKLAQDLYKASNSSRSTNLTALCNLQKLLMLFFCKTTLIVCGGQWFHDLSRANHTVITTLFFLVRVFNGRTGVFGVGIGPLSYRFSRLQMRLAFSKKSFLMVRDYHSRELLRQCGINSILGADLALTLKSKEVDAVKNIFIPDNCVGICPCAWTSFENIYENDPNKNNNTIEQLVKIVNYLVTKKKAVVFLPSMNPEDKIFSRAVINQLDYPHKVSFLDTEQLTAAEFQLVISQLNLLISMRLHPLIFAINVNCEFIGLNYAEKVRQLFQQFEIQESLVELSDRDWAITSIKHLEKQAVLKQNMKSREQIKSLHLDCLDDCYKLFRDWYLYKN